MKLRNKIAILFLISLVGIQFIPTKRNQNLEINENDFSTIYHIPKNIYNQLKVSCFDCHSNHTKYPWYNKIQPVAWLLENHINEGKSELNFSEFATYSKRKRKNKLKSIKNQIKKDEMPLWSYTLIHKDAKLTNKSKEEIIVWIQKILSENKN